MDIGGLLGEALAAAGIVAFWYACGMVPFEYFIPFVAFASIVLGRLLWVYLKYVCLTVASLSVLEPALAALRELKSAASIPSAAANPGDAVLHILVAAAAMIMVFTCTSEIPLLVLLWAHSALLTACLLELVVCRSLMSWKPGKRWLLVLQCGLFVGYAANLLQQVLPSVVAVPWSLTLLSTTMAWLVILTVISAAVNWSTFREYYSAWQRSNGSFHLGSTTSQQRRRKSRSNTDGSRSDSGDGSPSAADAPPEFPTVAASSCAVAGPPTEASVRAPRAWVRGSNPECPESPPGASIARSARPALTMLQADVS